MTNYLLSIDPSMKNTGFTLWEKTIDEEGLHSHGLDNSNPCNCLNYYKWQPIWIKSYSFNKFTIKSSLDLKWEIRGVIIPDINTKSDNSYPWLEKFDLIIERGIFNPKFGKGKETLDHLRGFIAGQFNKLITKDMLISSSEWRKWYLNQENIIDTLIYNENENIGIANNPNNKWNKDLSIKIVNYLTIINNWNIKISNHDEAESLLIGWYYLNKENK